VDGDYRLICLQNCDFKLGFKLSLKPLNLMWAENPIFPSSLDCGLKPSLKLSLSRKIKPVTRSLGPFCGIWSSLEVFCLWNAASTVSMRTYKFCFTLQYGLIRVLYRQHRSHLTLKQYTEIHWYPSIPSLNTRLAVYMALVYQDTINSSGLGCYLVMPCYLR